MTRTNKIIIIDLQRRGEVRNSVVSFGGIEFRITEHRLGWDVETAKDLIRRLDGYADGFSISGLPKNLGIGRTRVIHPVYLELVRAAVRTPIYLAETSREIFAKWTFQRLLKSNPGFLSSKKVLFQYALASPMVPIFEEAGATVWGCDAMFVTGKNVILRGSRQIELFMKVMSGANSILRFLKVDPQKSTQTVHHPSIRTALERAVGECDIFVGFTSLLQKFESLRFLSGKTLIVDVVGPDLREKIEESGAAQVIELAPSIGGLVGQEGGDFTSFSLLTAMIDQRRISEESPLTLEDYLLSCIQELDLKPRKAAIRRAPQASIERRCAFIIHPLSQTQLWNNSAVPFVAKAPLSLRRYAEAAAARVPIFRYGSIRGIESRQTGQKVTCDLYAMAATPKQLLRMNEEFIYRRLVEAVDLAKRNGASLVGLGAYTKVVGDAGVTVAKRASLPVTNGNSYSASATLWAARAMTERMGLINPEKVNGRFQAKAMILGATGGIGRVSALLVSLVFDELVLVAPRPDRLLELREEILEVSPHTRVKLALDPNPELRDTDLIVTATSNQGGAVLDIMKVKPGAVICDCSRPLDIGQEEAKKRPDVMVIESGEIDLPGNLIFAGDLGLPKPAVYACLAETALLTLEGRYESFSLSKHLSMEKVKEIYRIGVKHGAQLSAVMGPNGVVGPEEIDRCRKLALERLGEGWAGPRKRVPDWKSLGLKTELERTIPEEDRSEAGE